VLCVLAGPDAAEGPTWQPASQATTILRHVDKTPPERPISVQVHESAEDARVEPIFDLPEQALFELKTGAPDATRCADPAGYVPYRRIAVHLAAADLPARVCIRSWDEAGNEAEPTWERVLERK